jgi:hypothetical protein
MSDEESVACILVCGRTLLKGTFVALVYQDLIPEMSAAGADN